MSDILLNSPPDCILILIEYLANAVYFKPEQRNAVIASNIGILAMIYASKVAISTYGTWAYMKYYFIPWLLVNHWFTMITYVSNSEYLSEYICLTRTCIKLHTPMPNSSLSIVPVELSTRRGGNRRQGFLGLARPFLLARWYVRIFPVGGPAIYLLFITQSPIIMSPTTSSANAPL